MTKLLVLVLYTNVVFLNVIIERVKGDYCETYWDCEAVTECCRQNKCVKCSNPGCKLDLECTPEQLCCKGGLSEPSQCGSCWRQSCATDGDCIGTGKCCRSNICVTSCRKPKGECDYDYDCRSGEYCCKEPSGYGNCSSNCIGMFCRNYSDCARNEICSSNKCTHVIWCTDKRDCPTKQCCNSMGRCEDCNFDYGMPAWMVTVITFASIIAAIIILVLLTHFCCKEAFEQRQRELEGINRSRGITLPVIDCT